jgi:hypothetical protein
MVREEDAENGEAVIRRFLENIASAEEGLERPVVRYSCVDKIRMVCEGLLFGWVMPGSSRRQEKGEEKKNR